ncbi:hypothetical protein RHECNPAF_14110046 [Rhizobium etli CNPAF512]|nr:hypothetical protein RHECNPAF_14110046 [Rhizobium etli CNPAF512]
MVGRRPVRHNDRHRFSALRLDPRLRCDAEDVSGRGSVPPLFLSAARAQPEPNGEVIERAGQVVHGQHGVDQRKIALR